MIKRAPEPMLARRRSRLLTSCGARCAAPAARALRVCARRACAGACTRHRRRRAPRRPRRLHPPLLPAPRAPLVAPAPAPAPAPAAPPPLSVSIFRGGHHQPRARPAAARPQGTQRPPAQRRARRQPARGLHRGLVEEHARPSSRSTATSARAASCFTTSRWAATTRAPAGGDPQYLWPIPLDQSYTGVGRRTRARRSPSAATNAHAQLAVQRQDRVGRQPALPPQPRDPHLGQPADHVADRSARQPRPRVDAQLVRDAARHQRAASRAPAAPTGYSAGHVQRRLRAGELRAHQLLLHDAGAAHRRRQRLDQNSIDVQARVGRVHDARRPGPLRPHARPVGPRHRGQRGQRHRQRLPVERRPHHVRHGRQVDGPLLRRRLGLPVHRARPTPTRTTSTAGSRTTRATSATSTSGWPSSSTRPTPSSSGSSSSRGDFVLNGGIYTVYRSQYVDHRPRRRRRGTHRLYGTATNNGLEPRQAWAVIPDALGPGPLAQAALRGRGRHHPGPDRLPHRPQRERSTTRSPSASTAWRRRPSSARSTTSSTCSSASAGRAATPTRTTPASAPCSPRPPGSRPSTRRTAQPLAISTFRFHPDYRVDLIFWRNIMSRVEGAYYFRPSVDYDFLRHPDGEKFGGGAAVIWSRASEFDADARAQARPRRRARPAGLLPVEGRLAERRPDEDRRLLHDAPVRRLLPPRRASTTCPARYHAGFDTGLSAAQTVRLFLGIVF